MSGTRVAPKPGAAHGAAGMPTGSGLAVGEAGAAAGECGGRGEELSRLMGGGGAGIPTRRFGGRDGDDGASPPVVASTGTGVASSSSGTRPARVSMADGLAECSTCEACAAICSALRNSGSSACDATFFWCLSTSKFSNRLTRVAMRDPRDPSADSGMQPIVHLGGALCCSQGGSASCTTGGDVVSS